jgi:hypothetical protein
MKTFIWVLICFFAFPVLIMAQSTISNNSSRLNTNKKKIRKETRKKARKEMPERFRIGLYGTYAFINSSARFEGPNSILSINIDLEEHLGLVSEKMIYYGTFVYHITPRSGINAMYYSLNREKDHVLDRDIIFLDDTIPKGQVLGAFMNTSIVSLGYIFSIIADENSFLGAFVNLYFANVKVGVNSDVLNVKKSSQYYAATPNFGVLANFKLKEWMSISGGIGFFFLDTEDWKGSFQDLQITADFSPQKWLGLSIGYQSFSIQGTFPQDNYTAHLNYSLMGPAFGIKFKF